MIYKEYGKTRKRLSSMRFGEMRFKKEDYKKSQVFLNYRKVVH